jgi:serine/threonine protein kinase
MPESLREAAIVTERSSDRDGHVSQQMLGALASGRVDDKTRAVVDQHLFECDECLLRFDELRRELCFSGAPLADETRESAVRVLSCDMAVRRPQIEPLVTQQNEQASPSPVAGPGRLGREVLIGTLVPGTRLVASEGATYQIRMLKDGGLERFTETYEGVIAPPASNAELGRPVTVKFPHVASDMSRDTAEYQLEQLNTLFDAEARELGRLKNLDCVGQLLDSGTFAQTVAGVERKFRFYVQADVGMSLDAYLRLTTTKEFSGLRAADDFFAVARAIAKTMNQVHGRNVVHGHIWPGNIRIDVHPSEIDDTGKPKLTAIFTDFGQPLVSQTFPDTIPAVHHRSLAYRPPEGRCSFIGDMFSIGGVLFHLATGDDPPLTPHADYQKLKEQIADRIQRANPALYEDDCSVVDVIARCLRQQPDVRLPSAMKLVQIVDTFLCKPSESSVHVETKQILTIADQMDHRCGSFFKNIAVRRLQELRLTFKGLLDRQAIDIYGDPEEIRYMGTAFMSAMGPGSMFLSVARHRFWWPGNIGIDDMFLSMTKRAAKRGAVIKRVFLLDQAAFSDQWLPDIIKAQRRVVQELGCISNYCVRFRAFDPSEEPLSVGESRFFALFASEKEQIAMYPTYMDNGQLHGLRFRNGHAEAAALRQQFENCMRDSRPLSDFEAVQQEMKRRPLADFEAVQQELKRRG